VKVLEQKATGSAWFAGRRTVASRGKRQQVVTLVTVGTLPPRSCMVNATQDLSRGALPEHDIPPVSPDF
jgi:hypothetical protein